MKYNPLEIQVTRLTQEETKFLNSHITMKGINLAQSV